jgi:hypothetical protein
LAINKLKIVIKYHKMKKNTLKILILLAVLFTANLVFAQTPPSRTPPDPPGVPLDGGIITLFVVAFGIAIKKLGFNSKK